MVAQLTRFSFASENIVGNLRRYRGISPQRQLFSTLKLSVRSIINISLILFVSFGFRDNENNSVFFFFVTRFYFKRAVRDTIDRKAQLCLFGTISQTIIVERHDGVVKSIVRHLIVTRVCASPPSPPYNRFIRFNNHMCRVITCEL